MSESQICGQVRLKKNEERRLLSGHLWVFSNEIDTQSTPLKGFSAGDWVEVISQRGKKLGVGYVNPASLISVRLCDHKAIETRDWLLRRLKQALETRQRLYQQPYYRWVHGEADLLPGLVIDRYGDLAMVQINTAGIERHKDLLGQVIQEVVALKTVVFKNDNPIRKLENLPLYVETILGEAPQQLEVIEREMQFSVPYEHLQKTGWFYDQRDNRKKFAVYAEDARVLDLYAYLGGWGIAAAKAGAREVICVDSASYAREAIVENARRNDCESRVIAEHMDVETFLTNCIIRGERFDFVVVDPPALIQKQRDLKKGEAAYQRINRLAQEVLNDNGFLVSCSCSHHLRAEQLRTIVQKTSRQQGRHFQLLAWGQQGLDHPVHPAMPETAYLKAVFGRVINV